MAPLNTVDNWPDKYAWHIGFVVSFGTVVWIAWGFYRIRHMGARHLGERGDDSESEYGTMV